MKRRFSRLVKLKATKALCYLLLRLNGYRLARRFDGSVGWLAPRPPWSSTDVKGGTRWAVLNALYKLGINE